MTPEDKKLWERVTEGMKSSGISFENFISRIPSIRERFFISTTLDLHGLDLNSAYIQSVEFIKIARIHRFKYVTIITGLSGQIKREFPLWMETLPHTKRIEVLSGGGAFKVFLQK